MRSGTLERAARSYQPGSAGSAAPRRAAPAPASGRTQAGTCARAARASAGGLAAGEPCSTSGRDGAVCCGGRSSIDAEWAGLTKPATTSGLGAWYAAQRQRHQQRQRQQQQQRQRPNPQHPGCGAVASSADAACADALLAMREVFVIIFGACGSEGIYCLRTPGPDGLPLETIVAFESRADAERYRGLVESAMDAAGPPTVCGLPPQELAAFASERGYTCRLELAGSRLAPPARSVAMTDWERALRLRQGTGFTVLEEEPQLPTTVPPPSPLLAPASAAAAAAAAAPAAEGQVLPRAPGELSREQIAAAVAALESLLNAGGGGAEHLRPE
ncbi:hypothetical protein Rsub_12115 [Raphidocelis subcapitata]|uniref:Uncharacterized protein n=1 Tax=Raphidocelis subcapitata TaxID=307507 RepID=A0A2V0PH06_9CHLO|nr:hypothetical protein Rsub_12115 [Raphidocelis subcapitata]|eukprot:GBF99148.1 hypothetical protein Rsub_12115 [Raphidocelis subcapitata]